VTSKITKRELAERFFAIQRAALFDPITGEHERLRGAGGWTKTNDACMGKGPEQRVAAVVFGIDLHTPKDIVHRAARETTSTFQRAHRGGLGAIDHRAREPELRVTCLRRVHDARAREAQDPKQIFGSQKMQGSAHGPRAHDLSGGERALHVGVRRSRTPQTNCPFCGVEILRLHRCHPTHGLLGTRERTRRNLLTSQS
jgi:hypothetical protein